MRRTAPASAAVDCHGATGPNGMFSRLRLPGFLGIVAARFVPANPMSSAPNKPEDLSFEEAMQRLEEIVSSMEGERMSLEEMVRSYEEGVKLLRVCRQRIDTAKRRVELITADLDGGKASLEPFEPESATESAAPDDDPAKARGRRRKSESTTDDIRLF